MFGGENRIWLAYVYIHSSSYMASKRLDQIICPLFILKSYIAFSSFVNSCFPRHLTTGGRGCPAKQNPPPKIFDSVGEKMCQINTINASKSMTNIWYLSCMVGLCRKSSSGQTQPRSNRTAVPSSLSLSIDLVQSWKKALSYICWRNLDILEVDKIMLKGNFRCTSTSWYQVVTELLNESVIR